MQPKLIPKKRWLNGQISKMNLQFWAVQAARAVTALRFSLYFHGQKIF